MVVTNYYISDLHFGHKNAIGFDKRPYFTVEEMDQSLIQNWNSVVTDDDTVYVLGDMFWNNQSAPEILSQLKGRKYLILGNHDRINADMRKHFVWIKEIETIKDGDKHVILFHYPIAHWKNQYYEYIHLYGHIHRSKDNEAYERYKKICQEQKISFQAYNVGCMMPYMDYIPRALSEIINYKGE